MFLTPYALLDYERRGCSWGLWIDVFRPLSGRSSLDALRAQGARYLSEQFHLANEDSIHLCRLLQSESVEDPTEVECAARICLKPVETGKGSARPEKSL